MHPILWYFVICIYLIVCFFISVDKENFATSCYQINLIFSFVYLTGKRGQLCCHNRRHWRGIWMVLQCMSDPSNKTKVYWKRIQMWRLQNKGWISSAMVSAYSSFIPHLIPMLITFFLLLPKKMKNGMHNPRKLKISHNRKISSWSTISFLSNSHYFSLFVFFFLPFLIFDLDDLLIFLISFVYYLFQWVF